MCFHRVEIGLIVQPLHDLGGAVHGREPDDRPPRHPVVGDGGVEPAVLERPAAPVSGGHQTPLCGRHGDVYLPSVQGEGPYHPYGDRHVADHVLAAGPHHLLVVVVLVWQRVHGPPHVALLPDDLPTDLYTPHRVVEDLFQLVAGYVLGLHKLDDLLVYEAGGPVVASVHDLDAFGHLPGYTLIVLNRRTG